VDLVTAQKDATASTTRTRLGTREVDEMAASTIIEEETGTSTSGTHAHRGYYAGDFFARVPDGPSPSQPSAGPRIALEMAS
jgi:hypothetical protein